MRLRKARSRSSLPGGILLLWEAAKVGQDMGATIIDINMGCPARKVTGKLAGSALMQDEDLCARIFHAVRDAVDIPVTVKMRLGWDGNHLNAPTLARYAEEAGFSMISVMGAHVANFIKDRRIGLLLAV